MDEFGSLQGRTYELGGLAGAVCALRSFKLSEICEKQIARITSQLDKFNLRKIYQQFEKEFDISALDLAYAKSARSVLSSRLFQGYASRNVGTVAGGAERKNAFLFLCLGRCSGCGCCAVVAAA